ncbi:hypothetical protein SKAU_G00101230 [Synaphobranchus kaupii]|uniref:Uncharacterized protein n=1 Tax=Synaphobranchus kaupii TaxID=118154 RepID=A0A9Q1J596_SYNKA|nr:hypothetical protein SKAU_G00101230 [Synaphobranchus kaupii]
MSQLSNETHEGRENSVRSKIPVPRDTRALPSQGLWKNATARSFPLFLRHGGYDSEGGRHIMAPPTMSKDGGQL